MDTDIKTTDTEDYAARILELSNYKVDPDSAKDLWSQILQHKWVLSEKIGRDVGIKVACLDFIDNIVSLEGSIHDEQRVRNLKRLGAQILDKSAWETISESQPPKQVVEKRIVLPV